MSVVRSAGAAEVPRQGGQVPAQQPPVVAPSSGLGAAGETALQRTIRADGFKIQLREARRVIDGNQVEIEKKFAIAAACVIFVFLGAPIALRFPRGGVGLTIGVSLGVFGLYYVGLIGGETLARGGWLSPFWAMWTPNIILVLIGGYLTARLGSEGTTTRGSETTELLHRLRERFARMRRTPA
jgi:lipopolysaccharide export system permease protein